MVAGRAGRWGGGLLHDREWRPVWFGVQVNSGTVTISGLTITNGLAVTGGGIYNNSTVGVTGSTFSDNNANYNSGAIDNGDDGNTGTLTVSEVSPNSGPESGDQPITITGSGFVVGAQVVIGQGQGPGAGALSLTNVVVVSNSEITANTPVSTRKGTGHVVVITPGGQSPASSNDVYRYG
jgi:hypothetical protein